MRIDQLLDLYEGKDDDKKEGVKKSTKSRVKTYDTIKDALSQAG